MPLNCSPNSLGQRIARQLLRLRQEHGRSPVALDLPADALSALQAGDRGAARKAWAGVAALLATGCVRIVHDKDCFDPKAPWVSARRVEWTGADEQWLMAQAGFAPSEPYVAELLDHLSVFVPPEHPALALARQRPPRIPGIDAADMASRLLSLRLFRNAPWTLGEVSAHNFDGRSDFLAGITDLVAALLEVPVLPWPSAPVSIQVRLTDEFAMHGVVLVSNATTFHRLRDNVEAASMALVNIAQVRPADVGWLRDRRLCTAYYDGAPAQVSRFEQWLFGGESGVAVFFMGDLDFASMALLKQLREHFPGAQAWSGYHGLLTHLRFGTSYTVHQAGRGGQVDPGHTGCVFADAVLLPEIRRRQRFVDAEVLVPERNAG